MLHGATLAVRPMTPLRMAVWAGMSTLSARAIRLYVPDQISRARSGFDIATYNEVRAGVQPGQRLPNFWRFTDELVWTQFRFGPSFGTAFPDEQFPVEAAAELARQAIPDLKRCCPRRTRTSRPRPIWRRGWAAPCSWVTLRQACCRWTRLLANPTAARRLILVEPGGCRANQFTDEQIATLATMPILVVFGDHLDARPARSSVGRPHITIARRYRRASTAAGGTAEMLHPPDLGIRGNSHMIMQDGNLQIAGPDPAVDRARTQAAAV